MYLIADCRPRLVTARPAALTIVFSVMLASCTSAPPLLPRPMPSPVVVQTPPLPAPSLTRVEGFADHLELTWRTYRTEHDLIAGYDVYVATSPGLDRLPAGDQRLKAYLYGGSVYPGDTDGIIDSESISVTPTVMGTRYFAHVRTVFPDGHQGPPSAEREVIARPRGSLTLRPRFTGAADGFSFAADRNVSSLSDSNDMYLFVGKDGPCLGSPARLDAMLRRTVFVSLGPSASIDDFPACPTDVAGADKTALVIGNSIGVVTADGHMAKLRPREIAGVRDTPSVVFDYIYQPVLGETHF